MNIQLTKMKERRETLRARGFTLIETLVAVTILTLAVSGPLFVASRALVAAQNARHQLIATYLAQEGIEYVRAMRDREFIVARSAGGANVSETAWDSFANGSNAGSIAGCRTSDCIYDVTRFAGVGPGLALQPCTNCAPLRFATTTGTYAYDSASPVTPYTRVIRAQLITGSDMLITSTVRWTTRLTTYQVTITDHLTPWQ
jgi:prepilin-type N-terminal cleavage/methylation domain-containing protein